MTSNPRSSSVPPQGLPALVLQPQRNPPKLSQPPKPRRAGATPGSSSRRSGSLELSSLSLIYPVSSSPGLSAGPGPPCLKQCSPQSPRDNSPAWAACQTTVGTFRDELQRAAEYSEAGLALLGPIVEEFVAQPVATLATRHLGKQGRGGVGSNPAFHGLVENKPGGVFLWHPKGSGMGTFNAPGRSSRLATLSPRRVSVKAGQGDECSYLARLENSSWPHLAHT